MKKTVVVAPKGVSAPRLVSENGQLLTRNGHTVQLLPCVCVKGGYCHRAAHLLGQPCDNICRISKNVRHRVCKACRSGGRKGNKGAVAVGRTPAVSASSSGASQNLNLRNPENDAGVNEANLAAVSDLAAMMNSPRDFEGFIGQSPRSGNAGVKVEGALSLSNFQSKPLTHDGRTIVMRRQPECFDEDPMEKSLLNRVGAGPITYSNVNNPTPRDQGDSDEVGETPRDPEGHRGVGSVAMLEQKPNKKARFSLMRPEETEKTDQKSAETYSFTPRTEEAVQDANLLLSHSSETDEVPNLSPRTTEHVLKVLGMPPPRPE